MKLVNVTVQMFKNILDSTEVEVQPDVTCLVGKNEAGKSAFLNALYRLNPARPNVSFSVQAQYPAWLEKRHRQRGDVLDEVNPVTATFELEDDDLAVLRAKFGLDVLTDPRITFARNYKNEWTLESSSDESVFVAHVINAAAAPKTVATGLKAVSTVADLRTHVKILKASEDEAKKAAATSLEGKLTAAVGTTDLADTIGDVLEPRVPRFFYYSEYSNLPSRLKIRELLKADPKSLSDDHLTARSLLQMAATDDEYLLNADYELRKRELENVANLLTQDVLQYWTQNPDLRVNIDVSQETVAAPTPHVVIDELKIRMWDERHWLSLPFDEHSTGFRWFFSFLAAFSQYEFKKDPIIILLDEPGLGLHARAQKDFLRFIDERLAKPRQVLYTTHSPFMVQPGRLERARIVEDKGKEKGSQVTSNVLSTDPDTLFPLQGALGYDLVQHLFIGESNLVVEGTSDFTYLTVVSDFVPETRTKLDARWSIVPVGGVDLIPTFVALLGQHLNLTVVIDSRREGVQRLANLAADGYLKNKRIIAIGEIVNQKQADIEDLFTVEDYLTLYNAAFGKAWKVADIPVGTDSLVSRIARLESVDRFDHGKPADVFLRRRDEFLHKLSAATLDNFESLFKRVNSTLGT
jgi:energy-coupling factor transporter ATP-binding protein EcfA2